MAERKRSDQQLIAGSAFAVDRIPAGGNPKNLVPEEFKQAQNVLAMKNPSNRVREIVVSWNGPKEEMDISHFNVYLRFDENAKTQIHEVDPRKSDMKVIFKDLKSDTEYKAFVTTVFKNKSTVITESDVVKTDPAQRTPGFNVELRGKPLINMSKEEKGGDIFGVFGWDLPDLGIDGGHYKIASEEPILKQDGTVKIVFDFENRHAKDVKLSWGKSYSFTVVCNYLDLDSRTFHKVQATEILNAGIGKHSLDDVKWIDNLPIVSWSKAKGAKKHFLTVFDEEEKLVFGPETVKQPPTNLETRGKLAYGKMYKFVLEAHDATDKINREEKKILLGGNDAVTKVVAERDRVNPRRALYVTWKPPVNPCHGYKLILYNLASSKSTELYVPQSTVGHRFYELKTSTNYCLRVCPIYDGKVFEGTLSNNVQTEKRIDSVAENNAGFGQPEKIVHAVKASLKEKSVVELSWTSVQMGENFKITGYHVTCHRQRIAVFGQWFSQLTRSTICDKVVRPDETSIELDLNRGLKFDVKVSTIYIDLDTDEKTEISKDHEILTDPSETVIYDCTWKNGVVYFSWEPVNGAVKYRLVVKDGLLRTNLVQDQNFVAETLGDRCEAKLQMSEELRIGKTCMTKVYVYSAGKRISETDWKSHVLGGEKVPRNVEARKNLENPKRSVIITFDFPAKGPASEYKIVAIPESGLRRTLFCKTSNAVFEYLRKGVKYKFEVHARWDRKWSEGSPSNSISTEGDKGKPFMDVQDKHKTKEHLTNAVFIGKSVDVNVRFGTDFGQVEDLEPKIEADHFQDILILKWNAPNFDKKTADHKVEMYKIELGKQNDSGGKTERVEFKKNRIEYQTEKLKIELGETYQAAVSTIYLDIDQDHVFKSTAVKKEIVARPCIPECIRNDYVNETLRMEWNATKGAQRYELELFANEDTKATFRYDMGKKTAYEKKFDERFGYGTSYYAMIKAFGVSGKENSVRTPTKIIGGDHVVTNVCATSNHEKVKDPSTQVFLNWTAPKKLPKKYEVASLPYVESMILDIDGTKSLVSGLKAGTEYYFKVKAIHEEKGKLKPSGGCCSERISTTPTPTQVKKVWTKLGENPSTSVQICWEKVDAEKEHETTKYRIKLVKDDDTTKREVYVTTEYVILRDLDSGSTFYATVAGGNSMGYGRDSERVKFTTDLGTPKDVVLKNNEETLCSSLILTFANAEGEPTGYKAILYKLTNKVEELVGDALEVKPGHTFHDLESNREYLVKLYAGFASGEGKVVTSKVAMTAPAETRITECRCAVMENGEKSPKDIFVKWNSDKGCNIHEITVMYGVPETTESRLSLKDKDELNYSCMKSSIQYSVRVRSRNERGRFGKWSNEALINLVPEKLRGVSATLEKNGNDILIECNAASTHLPRYFMQALCNNKMVEDPQESQEESEKVVKWRFTPPECAQVYQFKLWAENDDEIRGEKILTSPVISRPAKILFKSVMLMANHESTDVVLEWEKQQRCDTYEISICAHERIPETMARTRKTEYRYRCQIPGKMYLVSIRAIREGIKGDWSEDEKVFLAPSEVNFLPDLNVDNEPVTFVEVKWEPLGVQPSGYRLKLFCNEEEVDEVVTTDTNHKFTDKLKPGSLCFCTVVAFNESEVIGKSSKSRTFRIKWLQASNFIIENDENDPSRRAKMKWDAPPGVNCFHLEIENNQNGVVTPIYLSISSYVFGSGIPGHIYSVRLYSGCDGRYDIKHVSTTMIMNPSPPEELRVKNFKSSPHDSILICFKDMNGGRFTKHEVVVEDLARKEEPRRETTSRRTLLVEGLTPGATYIIAVGTLKNGKKSEMTCYDGQVTTYPDVPEVVSLAYEKGKVIFTWKSLDIKPTNYEVRWEEDGAIRVRKVEEERFVLGDAKLSTMYKFTVAAVNEAGRGFFNNWRECLTGLAKPSQVEVSKITQRSAWIQFSAPQKEPPSYRVSVTPRFCEKSIKPKIVKKNYCVVENLKPGTEHVVQVWSIDPESPNLDSEKTAPKYFITAPAPVEGIEVIIDSTTSRNVKWKAAIGAARYIPKLKKAGCSPLVMNATEECECHLSNLDVHSKYMLSVTAENAGGKSEESDKIPFETGPPAPVDVKAESISTREVKFSCEECRGATEYLFHVNGEDYPRKSAELILSHESDIMEFNFKVSASGVGGCSEPSATFHHNQLLLEFRVKNLKKAKDYNSNFIFPSVSDISSGNSVESFETENFSVGVGKTACLFGTDFSGKTSCALQYLQKLPANLLPIFLSWNHYKTSKENRDIKSVLSQQMKHLGEREKDFIFQWMKSNSDQVVFVVDDLSLSHNVTRKIKLYDDAASVEEIFYSLVSTDREIFSQSQVFCSTSQRDLMQIIKPNYGLEIDGFDSAQIQKMTKKEFGDKRDIPNHLEWFCVNPFFCVRILKLIKKSEPSVDKQSYSSVLMKLLSDGVSRYPEDETKEKLRGLWKQIQDAGRIMKTVKIDPSNPLKMPNLPLSTASLTQGAQSQIDLQSFRDFTIYGQEEAPPTRCCATLHDCVVKAMYLAFSCPLEEFKHRLHKKSVRLGANAYVWILAAGLLREQTANASGELFSVIDCKLNMKNMRQKLEFTKNFAKENLKLIHGQMLWDFQIPLDWLDIINEIDAHNIIRKYDWKVSVKNSHEPAEIEQMKGFLGQVRGIFLREIRVKFEKDLSAAARIPIETAMRNNPDGEIQKNGSTSSSVFRRGGSNLSFRSVLERASVKSDPHSKLDSTDEEASSQTSRSRVIVKAVQNEGDSHDFDSAMEAVVQQKESRSESDATVGEIQFAFPEGQSETTE